MTGMHDVWADRLADALGRAFVEWLRPTGREPGVDGDVRWFPGVPGFPPFNIVMATGRTIDLEALTRAELAMSAVEPEHRVSARACVEDVVGPWALERGYGSADRAPALVLEGASFAACVSSADLSRARRVLPSEVATFSDTAAGVFGLPADRIRVLTPPSLAEDPRSSLRAAVLDDRIVGTAQSWTDGDAIGVFNVAVLDELRGRGIGSALTAAVVADGAAEGATWAYLQSSDEGLSVYQRLGFEVVDEWCSWMPDPSG